MSDRRDAVQGAPRTPRADGHVGFGGRLERGPAAELVESGYALEIADAALLHDGFALADVAHAVALAESGILPAQLAPRLLGPLLEMAAMPAEAFPYDSALGDPWSSRHRELERRAPEAAGWLRIGRPRREAGRVAFRLAVRRRLLDAYAATLALGVALLEQARSTKDAIVADYTYLQPAEPTTFGYLLLGALYPLLRHVERFRHVFGTLNRSPAGAGGVGGTPLPLDRGRMSELLGFEAPIVHARDAMWETDSLVEVLSAVAGAAAHAGQLAADLEIFASPAFGLIELDDSLIRPSALMPQKRNPYPVAIVRGTAGVLAGRLAGFLAVLHTPSARTDHFVFAYGEVPRALDLFSGSERLLAAAIAGLRFDRTAMASSARRGFLEASGIATSLAIEADMSYGEAHRLVGLAVRLARAVGRDALSIEDLVEAGVGDRAEAARLIQGSVDPVGVVAARGVEGGTAPARIAAMLRSCGGQLRRAARWQEATSARIQGAEQDLLRLASRLAREPVPTPRRGPRTRRKTSTG